MIGIRDADYPNYRSIATPAKAADITKCQNTTNDTAGKPCRVQNKDLGWYVTLKDFAKVSAQPKVNNGYVGLIKDFRWIRVRCSCSSI